MKLIFLGPPGAGKGTQAERVAKEFAIPQISTGEILRQAMREGTKTGLEAKTFIEKGELVPDGVILEIVRERLRQPDCESGYLLDGFPRTLPQAEALEGIARIDWVLNLSVGHEVIVERLSGRRSCEGCGHSTHIGLAPDGICPICGKRLVQRADDAAEAVENRLRVYDAQTKPLIGFYEGKGRLLTVDGGLPIDEVTATIFSALRRAAE
ncbi:MAG: adenylate kinase [Christensenellaceae bacterium]|jgi:adenylate kinase|nr:adenylate kinase [Christensenellaceae bacterium]